MLAFFSAPTDVSGIVDVVNGFLDLGVFSSILTIGIGMGVGIIVLKIIFSVLRQTK